MEGWFIFECIIETFDVAMHFQAQKRFLDLGLALVTFCLCLSSPRLEWRAVIDGFFDGRENMYANLTRIITYLIHSWMLSFSEIILL